MKKIISRPLIRALSCALALMFFAGNSQAQTTTFTYQGSLVISGSLASGSYDLQFMLYDQLSGGSLQGSPNTVTVSGVAVTSGVFSVDLDFGASAFPGAGRYLEISVRPASSGSFTTLSPRQQLTSTPYAIRSLNSTSADTALNYSGSGASITNLSASNISDGTLDDARLSSNVATLTGNQTFTGNKVFSGVNGLLATGTSGSGSIPATGAGVRMMWYPNKWAFRAGQATGTEWDDANVGNGSMALGSIVKASGAYSVAMGINSMASGGFSFALGNGTIASGISSVAMGNGANSGGHTSFALGNSAIASGNYAVAMGLQTSASGQSAVALGENNQGSGNNSVALGRYASTGSRSGSFVFNDSSDTNLFSASTNNQFNVRATGGLRFFASSDTSDTTKPGLFISGTTGNTQINGNLIQSGTLVQFTATDGFVAKGTFASGSIPATGGGTRMMWYPGKQAFRAGFISGSEWDDENIGTTSVAMGHTTTASGFNSVALGGSTVASGGNSVALGSNTTASGNNTTALGSYASTNGKTGSFVYGDNSTTDIISATADNQFIVRAQNLWFGTNNSVTNTSGRFLETSTGAYLTSGGTWTNSSSRSLKTNFALVNPRDVLQKVLQLPIQTWNYKAEDAKVRHIGAISQDFNRLFGFGDSAETISTVDADGVAMAAIQGLHEELKDRDAKLEQQQRELGQIKQQLKQQQAVIDGMRKLLCAQTPQADVCQKQ